MARMIERRVQVVSAGLVGLLAAMVAQAVWAQSAARPAAPVSTSSSAAPNVPSAASPAWPRPGTELRIVEDDQVRIEETRVRGQLQRVTVAPKGSTMRSYEINVGAGGRDPSQDKSAAGQRVWSVLRF